MAAQNEPLDPDWIASQEFDTSFRGFDQAEVRNYLRQLAKAVRADQMQSSQSSSDSAGLSERIAELEESEARLILRSGDLEEQLSSVDHELESLQNSPATVALEDLDSSQLTQLLGEETVRVLDSARSAAADIRAKAENEAAERTAALDVLQRETTTELAAKRKSAEEDAAQLRSEADVASKSAVEAAESEAKRVTSEAAAAAEKLRSEAASSAAKSTEDAQGAAEAAKSAANDVAAAVKKRGEDVAKSTRLKAEEAAEATREAAEQVKSDAEAEASRLRAEAAADVETARDSAREEARLMLSEAQTLREKVLEDLVKRRRTARQQIDQAKAARDRLAAALLVARQQIDHATTELDVSVPEAKKAMNLTGTRSNGNHEQQMADLATGLDRARSAGKTLSPEQVSTAGDNERPARKAKTSQAPANSSSRSQAPAPAPTAETASAPEPSPLDRKSSPPKSVEQVSVVEQSVSVENDLVEDLSDDGLEAADGDDLTDIFARLRSGNTESDTTSDATPEAAAKPDVAATPEPTKPAPAKNRGATVAELAGQDADVAGTPAAPTEPKKTATTKASTSKNSAADTPAAAEPVEAVGHDADEPHEILPPFADRDIATTRFGPDLRRKLKRALADDQSDVLDRLRRAKNLSSEDLPPSSEQLAGFRKAAEQGLRSIASAGADSLGAKPVAASVVSELVNQLAKDLHSPLRAKVERAVSASGGDTDGVLEPVRAHYRDARSSGLPSLVEDAIAGAFALGAYAAIANKAKIKWVNDPRSATSPDCFDNTLETSVVKPKQFPTGHALPLGGPGCRCLVLPA